jgi:hypothetical protein
LWLSRRLLSGTTFSPLAEPSVEVLQRLLESDLGRIKLAHGNGKPVLGEVVRRHAAGLGDQLHRTHRGLVMAIGQHVDMGVRDALAVELSGGIRQRAIGETGFTHQLAYGLAKGLVAVAYVCHGLQIGREDQIFCAETYPIVRMRGRFIT